VTSLRATWPAGLLVVLGLGLGAAGASLAAVNHVPRIASLALSPSDVTRLGTVTARAVAWDPDGTRVSLGYRWLGNGSVIAGATGRSINLAAHAIRRGDRIAVRVTAGDGVLHVTRTSAAVIVYDAPPQVEHLEIDQHAPAGDATLTATLTASDPDRDVLAEQRAWSWSCHGSVTGTDGSRNLNFVAHGIGPGCQVELADRVSDGLKSVTATADSVTVIDREPVVGSVTLSPAVPTASDVVTAAAPVDDPDGDVTTTSCTWMLSETPLPETSCTLDLAAAGAAKGQTLDVALTADDGTLTASSVASTEIGDAPPMVSSVAIDNGSPQTNDTLSAVVAASDADGDAVALQYQWLLGGAPIDGATGAALDLSQAGNGDHGDLISVEVRAGDGEARSAWSAGDPVTIGNTSPQINAATIVYDPATGTATVDTSSSDADSDPLTVAVAWTINGQDAGATSTLNLHQAGAHLGDVIGAQAQVTDSNAAVSGWATAPPVTAATGPPLLVDSGVMPWAIMRQSYTVGTADVIYTDGSSPNNGAVSLPSGSGAPCVYTSGATSYRDEITGALAVCPLSVGQMVALKTGQNSGATAQGIDTRISSYQNVDQIAQVMASGGYIITSPTSPQLVRIPVVEDITGGSVWPSGSGNVKVVGFAWAVITGYTNFGARVNVWIVGATI
jgi:hypothetical protein